MPRSSITSFYEFCRPNGAQTLKLATDDFACITNSEELQQIRSHNFNANFCSTFSLNLVWDKQWRHKPAYDRG